MVSYFCIIRTHEGRAKQRGRHRASRTYLDKASKTVKYTGSVRSRLTSVAQLSFGSSSSISTPPTSAAEGFPPHFYVLVIVFPVVPEYNCPRSRPRDRCMKPSTGYNLRPRSQTRTGMRWRWTNQDFCGCSRTRYLSPSQRRRNKAGCGIKPQGKVLFIALSSIGPSSWGNCGVRQILLWGL